MQYGLRGGAVLFTLVLASCGNDADVGTSTSESDSSTTDPSTTSTTEEVTTSTATSGSACPDGWWDDNWTRRSLVTINNSGGQLEGFPVLLTFDGLDISDARLDGFDLRFVDLDGNRLPFDLDDFDTALGGVAWVRVPTLMQGDATPAFYVYFGYVAGSKAENSVEVWADASAVWHMGQAPEGVLEDSGVTGIDGTNDGTTTMAGQIANSRRFNAGETSQIDFGDASAALASGWSSLSLSMWVYPDYDADADWTTAARFVERGDAIVGGQLRRDAGQAADLGLFEFELGYGDGFTQAASIEIQRQQWNYVAIDFDGSQLTTYVNGTLANQLATVADTLGSGPGTLLLGGDGDGFGGLVDEVRIYEESFPEAWYDAQYRSMTDAMVTYGAVEACDG